MEVEAQSGQRALAADIAKARKEREAAWRHVSELKEQVCSKAAIFHLNQQPLEEAVLRTSREAKDAVWETIRWMTFGRARRPCWAQ